MIDALTLRDFGSHRGGETAVVERQTGLSRHGIEEPEVGFREWLFGLFRPQAQNAQELLVQGERQEQLRFERAKRAALVARDLRPVNPRGFVFGVDEQMPFAPQALDGRAPLGDLDVRLFGVADGVSRLKRVVRLNQHRHAHDVERFGNATGNRFQERPRLDEASHLIREVAQNLIGVVRFAEETAVHPAAKSIRKSPADGHDRGHTGQHE